MIKGTLSKILAGATICTFMVATHASAADDRASYPTRDESPEGVEDLGNTIMKAFSKFIRRNLPDETEDDRDYAYTPDNLKNKISDTLDALDANERATRLRLEAMEKKIAALEGRIDLQNSVIARLEAAQRR